MDHKQDTVIDIPGGLRQDLTQTLDAIGGAFRQQSHALDKLAQLYDREAYRRALRMVMETEGHLVVVGMGKSGHVGRKISATLASTGTPSFFLHPAEASHGDLGMITKRDTLLLVSYSGETEEILQLLPSLQSFGNKTIAITGKAKSTLARYADIVLDVHVDEEACPNNLVPTTSITVTSAIGDALALALMAQKDFRAADFARFHPGGSLGRRLLLTVADTMLHNVVPKISPEIVLLDLAAEMAGGAAGVAVVVDDDNMPIGVVTKDQLAVALRVTRRIEEVSARQCMSSEFFKVGKWEIIDRAEEIMRQEEVKFLVAVDENSRYAGIYKHDEGR